MSAGQPTHLDIQFACRKIQYLAPAHPQRLSSKGVFQKQGTNLFFVSNIFSYSKITQPWCHGKTINFYSAIKPWWEHLQIKPFERALKSAAKDRPHEIFNSVVSSCTHLLNVLWVGTQCLPRSRWWVSWNGRGQLRLKKQVLLWKCILSTYLCWQIFQMLFDTSSNCSNDVIRSYGMPVKI